MNFTAELIGTGKTATGLQVPEELVKGLGGGGRPKVTVTLNGFVFRSSIARMGGDYWLGVSAERREAAGVAAGDVLDVQVELDLEERTVDVPADLAGELEADTEAKAFWDTLSYSRRRWFVLSVEGAKQAETRSRRVARAMELLRQRRSG
ncbi:YdeI/OmpD-associated family protein [Nonomuraea roseola]|uniref:YdeI/OmpD-associated family protein n=1 Tax=Nonomuraea roseola TaxID=46179 RepID=A0ABV5Q543_9ACTN